MAIRHTPLQNGQSLMTNSYVKWPSISPCSYHNICCTPKHVGITKCYSQFPDLISSIGHFGMFCILSLFVELSQKEILSVSTIRVNL